MEPVRPDYGGAWIGGIIPALFGDRTVPWMPPPASEAEGVVLLVCDGLGWEMVASNGRHLPTISKMAGGPITTVAPSTTSAGLTSISTAVAPAEHGLVGYRMRVGGEDLNVLGWQAERGPDPATTQPVPPFLGRTVPVVTRAEFRHSGFTQAHLRDTTFVGWRTTSALVEHCRRLATDRHDFVHAYYDGIDKVAHEFGLRSGFFTAELAATDHLVTQLLDVLPSTWALLVTSDHGQVHVGADGACPLDEVHPMVSSYSGEGRFRTLHAKPGAARELAEGCRQAYGQLAWVFTRDELFDGGWLGQAASLTVRGRVGDVILAAKADVIFVDPSMPHEASMLSHHGSLTPAEMLVPLVGERGRL